METNPVKSKPTLELILVDDKSLIVEVTSYHLKLNSKLHVGAKGECTSSEHSK